MNRFSFFVCIIGFSFGLTCLNPVALAGEPLNLTGSGASFPSALYWVWFQTFSKDHKNLTIDYKSTGSGEGVLDLINHKVDFAGSDSAMTPEEIAKVNGGVVMLPMTAGEIVLAYNLPGNPKELKLPRDVYPDIFLGKIAKWNDARIQSANPGVKLPDLPITIVRRADSSGTTYVFTSHLSAISPEWKNGPGSGTTVNWPSLDRLVAHPKNKGVATAIKQTPGAIGYVEFGWAEDSKLQMANLQNKTGKFVQPNPSNGEAALTSVQLPENLVGWALDPEGENAYPITTFTWLLFYQQYLSSEKAKVLREMVEYAITEGQKSSASMGYIPLPVNVVAQVRASIYKIK